MTDYLNEVMLKFAKFLSLSWDTASETKGILKRAGASEFISDWTQANWELLVELPFRDLAGFENAFLEPYGEGADCNANSSRVWLPESLPTHRIICYPLDGDSIIDLLTGNSINISRNALIFDHFAAHSVNGWHEQASPFDCVLGYHDELEVLVHVEQISFAAEKIRDI